MDAVLLARIQFAVTVGFHFLFPPISIGLAWLLVGMEAAGWRRRDEVWVRMGAFLAKLLGLTFAVGVATGIVMEFQFGTNWSAYSKFVGDVFGAPLAAEGVFAFFLESGFLGLYLFGRGRVSKGVHFFSALMVAVGATISAFWILVANSWQQTPAGFVVANGRAEMTSFAEAVFNPSMWNRFGHVMLSSFVAGSFFVGGIAALMLLRGRSADVAGRALRLAIATGFTASILIAFPSGDQHARQVARTQPEKLAAMEGLFETRKAAPLVLFGIPKSDPPGLAGAIEIPDLLSLMVHGDAAAEVQGLDAFPPGDVPPVWMTFVSFHNMVLLGLLFQALTFLGLILWWRGRLDGARWFWKAMLVASPLPLVAIQFGWVAAEVGRQPWIVYRLLRTADAASPTVSAGEVLFSLVMFSAIYLLLLALYLYTLLRKVQQGPDQAPAAEVA
jgi:cytochrome d ubiquinol oxidase subunit I